ncbi:MAG: hypothetical protein KC419_17360 [Anaerolineales bacterium]|nr:hypothetical protein [Anaerolineales bacterium]
MHNLYMPVQHAGNTAVFAGSCPHSPVFRPLQKAPAAAARPVDVGSRAVCRNQKQSHITAA